VGQIRIVTSGPIAGNGAISSPPVE
jgi:hypothetical protein